MSDAKPADRRRKMRKPAPKAGRPADRCAMVIFGASGDLTKRKLIPVPLSLWRRRSLLPKEFALRGLRHRKD